MESRVEEAAVNGRATNEERGLVDLARLAVEDVVRLVQQEIALAKREVKEMLGSNIRAAIFLAVAALCLLFAVNLALVTLALAFGVHAVLVAGIEALLLFVIAAICALIGKSMLKIGPPQQTVTSLKEDAEWAKQLLKPNAK
ncbi:MAG: phage holin family protein [Chloroflexi bacterium]|nr:MAG: phage holin family protein [Chloroflexota bacterium]TME48316.1 MAG: phage holin family protein [Chloroflexota bacterium]